MKKVTLSLAVAALSGNAMASNDFNGSISGMSGAGYATADFSEGVLFNPSQLASRAPEKGGFAFLLNAGVLASDQDDLITQSDDLSDLIDEIGQSSVMTTSQATDLKNRLNAINGDQLVGNVGGNLVLAWANKEWVSAALVVKTNIQFSASPEVASSDIALINSFINQNFDPANTQTGLESTVNVKVAAVGEVGVALAKSFAVGETNKLQIGLTPKRVRVESYLYSQAISDFDSDDLEEDDYKVSGSGMDLDVGALYVMDKYRFGLTINNLKGQTFKTINPNETLELKRQMIVSAGYVKDWVKAEVSYDLNAIPSLAMKGDTQYLRAGVEFTGFGFLHLRGGLSMDTKNTMEDTYSIGLGAGSFSLAYITGDKRTEGVVLGGGIRF